MSESKNPNAKQIIETLNKARSGELQAIHQYMIQHCLLDRMDYGKLCAYLKLISIDEMRHAEKFAERIQALGGLPTCEMAGSIVQPQTINEIFALDINMESNTVNNYDEWAEVCNKLGDPGSAGLFNEINKEERIHLKYYSETMEHIQELGNAFLAKYAATDRHTGPIKSFAKLMEKEEF